MGDLGVEKAFLPRETTDDAEKNPTSILTRSHNLPVGLTWLQIKLGCPLMNCLHVIYPPGKAKPKPEPKRENWTPANERFRKTCLARAKRALHLSDSASADGVLAGADKLSEESLRDAQELLLGSAAAGGMTLNYDPTIGATASWPSTQIQAHQQQQLPLPPPPPHPVTRPLLPPGVMSTTPPVCLPPTDQVPKPPGPEDAFLAGKYTLTFYLTLVVFISPFLNPLR